ncbi:MAG TPA: beta-hexosaminidase [Candidatus Gallacutalibacter pullistercoris]|nr:beta-hexosaminidase [Candidatus Gallacutalibacter pullistercoris]
MRAFRAHFRSICLLLAVVLLLFPLGCSFQEEPSSSPSPAAQDTPSPDPTAAPAPTATPSAQKILEGILIRYYDGFLTIRTQGNDDYTFAVVNVPFSGLPGTENGAYFEIGYLGELDEEAGIQPVTVLSVEKTADADENLSSIPLAWLDNGVFSSGYSKAYVALQSMTTEEKVGQVLLGCTPSSGAGSDAAAYHLGGFVTFARDYEGKTRWQIQNMIQGWQSAAKIPLIIAVDEEGGDVVRISSNPNLRATPFRSPQLLFAMGNMELVQSDAAEKAKLLLDLGVNANLAPVADVSTDREDFIYSRSFGQGAEETAEYVTAVLEQFQKRGLSATLKHFPGYGSNSDTHTGASLDERSLSQLESRDLIPFQAGIDAGVYSILVSHNTVACMDKNLPASLSAEVHRYLREEMNFTGIIMTDDLSMQAVSGQKLDLEHGVYVQALLCGNDMILCSDYAAAYQEILDAVNNGIIPQDILDHAAFRIVSWKCVLGLM